MAIAPTPVAALNRAVAVGELEGPRAALALVDELDLGAYRPFHVVRAELLLRLGDRDAADDAFAAAIALCENQAERAFLERRRAGAR